MMRRFWIRPLILSLMVLFAIAPQVARAACTVPNQLTNGQTADASQVMANFNSVLGCVNALPTPGGSTNSLQYNGGSGTLGGIAPLTNGQIAIGSTGGPPQAAQLTAGAGIAISNGPGTITISGATTPYAAPLLANFTAGNTPTGTTAADTSTGLAMTYPSSLASWNPIVYWDNTPYSGSGTETITVGLDLMMIGTNNYTGFAGFAIGDGTGKFITFSFCNSGGGYQANVNYASSYTSYVSNPFYVPLASYGRFLRVIDDGTNFNFYVGADINSMIKVWSVAKNAYIGTPTQIGLVMQGNSQPVAGTFFDYTRTP